MAGRRERPAGRAPGRAALATAACVGVLGAAPAARATPPPLIDSEHVFRRAWELTAPILADCAARAATAGRAGTVWIDVLFPDRAPATFRLRTSPGLRSADVNCVRRVVSRHLMPWAHMSYDYVSWPIITQHVALGGGAVRLPPLADFAAEWKALVQSPPPATAPRARLQRRLRASGHVGVDVDGAGCLRVRHEERTRVARQDWLTASGTELPILWQPLVDRIGQRERVLAPSAFVIDGSGERPFLLVAGTRVEPGARRAIPGRRRAIAVEEPAWSRQVEVYCLRPVDESLARELDRDMSELVQCLAGPLVERLTRPRLEPPPERALHGLSLADTRYCGIDRAGAIACCGLRASSVPVGRFASVSIDDQYGCALDADGLATCWGQAALGAAPPAERFRRVSVAGGGACALTVPGAIRCWGTGTWWHTPAGSFVDVAKGTSDGYAVAADGSVVMMGLHAEPRAASGAVRVTARDCGACVLEASGSAVCYDESGRLTRFDGPVASVAPGCPGGCAVRADGTIVCREHGRARPAPVPAAAGPPGYAEIASTHDRFCATGRAGQIACWGTPWPGAWLGRRLVADAPR